MSTRYMNTVTDLDFVNNPDAWSVSISPFDHTGVTDIVIGGVVFTLTPAQFNSLYTEVCRTYQHLTDKGLIPNETS